jgi:hypothetical protein
MEIRVLLAYLIPSFLAFLAFLAFLGNQESVNGRNALGVTFEFDGFQTRFLQNSNRFTANH